MNVELSFIFLLILICFYFHFILIILNLDKEYKVISCIINYIYYTHRLYNNMIQKRL